MRGKSRPLNFGDQMECGLVHLAAIPGELPRARRALFGAHAHGVHQPAAELGVRLQIPSQFPFDGSAFRRARTPPDRRRRESAPFLDALKQGFPGGRWGQNERHTAGKRALDMLHRAGPFHLAERRMDDEELLAGKDARQQDGHALAVLAA